MKRKNGCNIIYASLPELLEAGYKQRREKVAIGDLLCATNTAQDTWIEISDEKSRKMLDPKKFFILGRK